MCSIATVAHAFGDGGGYSYDHGCSDYIDGSSCESWQFEIESQVLGFQPTTEEQQQYFRTAVDSAGGCRFGVNNLITAESVFLYLNYSL